MSVLIGPYPLSRLCNAIYCVPGFVPMVCNYSCRRPVLVIKIRGIPSGMQVAAAFPGFISYQSVASGAEYSKRSLVTLTVRVVHSNHGNNPCVSWYFVGERYFPVAVVVSEACIISKHYH